ncbi:MAG: FAD-dependent oxidoreductase [Armatimonadetes bacterium]|nr:FAD-dependent oxidoreductase [Armatimonadota bacterium]
MNETQEVIVIGGGPAGREAAKRAVRHGAHVTLITQKAFSPNSLDSYSVRFLAEQVPKIVTAFEAEGKDDQAIRTAAVRETLNSAFQLAARNYHAEIKELANAGVQLLDGHGYIADVCLVRIKHTDGSVEHLDCDSIILAVGEQPLLRKKPHCVLTTSDLRELTAIPESLIVLGSSSAALELAYFFAAHGTYITVVGVRKPTLYFLDQELRNSVLEQSSINSIQIITDVTAVAGTADNSVADILLSDGSHLDAACVLLCGEGRYHTEGLGLEDVGVRIGVDGQIIVDGEMRTNIPSILAVGSITGWHELPVVMAQAKVAAQNTTGGTASINYCSIPISTAFDPELGSVGLSEETARQASFSTSVYAASQTTASGKYRQAKVIADKQDGRVLGLHLVGDGALEAVYIGALAIHSGATVEDLAGLQHPFQAMAECIMAASRTLVRQVEEESRPLVFGPE